MNNHNCCVISGDSIRFFCQTTLFSFKFSLFDNVLENFSKFSPDQLFSNLTMQGIERVLETIISDAMLHTQNDYPVEIELNYVRNEIIWISLKSNFYLFPFYLDDNSAVNSKSITLGFDLKKLNLMKSYHLPVKETLSLPIDNDLLIAVKKMDSFLNYNDCLYENILKHGISYQPLKFEMDLFNIEYNESMLSFQSKFYGNFESDFNLPFFKIHYFKQQINIIIAGQMIALTLNEFVRTPNHEIMDIIVNLLKIKNLPIESMSHLQDYLLIQKMETI